MPASPEHPLIVRTGNSVVTFDGTVVEFFNFMEIGSERFHVSIIEQIEVADRRLLGTAVNVKVRASASWQGIPNCQNAGERSALEFLIGEVAAARDAWVQAQAA
jgi:hypothetical protein